MMGERLDKFLSSQGFGTRKEVGKLIRGGAVAVDGVPQRDPAAKIDPAAAVTVEGRPVQYQKYLYIRKKMALTCLRTRWLCNV